jgi:hypothetical protein
LRSRSASEAVRGDAARPASAGSKRKMMSIKSAVEIIPAAAHFFSSAYVELFFAVPSITVVQVLPSVDISNFIV